MKEETLDSNARFAATAGKIIAALTACSILNACDDGPTSPRSVPTPFVNVAPTPTPVPLPNVAGTWQGTARESGLCSSSFPATANFNQDGNRVTATLTTPGFLGTLTGQLQHSVSHILAAELTGTLTSGSTRSTVSGTATSSHMTLNYGAGFYCGVRLTLNR